MANGRNSSKSKKDDGRDPGQFAAIPFSVLDCPAYQALSHPARSLLMEVARQFHKDDNGRMLLSRAYLKTRGWESADVIQRAKAELLEGRFIHETVKGHRPNKASWYAVTWRRLDKLDGFDPGAAATFVQGAYRGASGLVPPTVVVKPPASRGNPGAKNAVLIPPRGTEGTLIAPRDGTEATPPVPPDGPMEAQMNPLPVPPDGHPLEEPSAAACARPAAMTRIGQLLASRVRPGMQPGYNEARSRLRRPPSASAASVPA